MNRAPIDMMLDGLTWVEIDHSSRPGGPECNSPVATHSGVLDLFGHSLRCYRLSNGQTVFHADDFEALMRDWLGTEETEGTSQGGGHK